MIAISSDILSPSVIDVYDRFDGGFQGNRPGMVDIVSKETRSRMMSGIRGRDTRPEVALRRALHSRGFRFRLNQRGLPGSPDIVLRKWNAVVFVHGCFWHRHPGCRFATTPSTRPEFWEAKFDSNVARDRRTMANLRDANWRVAVVWECSMKRDPEKVAETVSAWLRGTEVSLIVG